MSGSSEDKKGRFILSLSSKRRREKNDTFVNTIGLRVIELR